MVFLFVVFIGLVSWVISSALGYGLSGVGISLIFAGMMSFASYWWSDKIILSISGARPADKKTEFNFYTVTENLAMVARIPMPRLYVIKDSAPNAFATGRDPAHAVVCATTGLLDKLNRTELEGVIAHELSHVRNYDIRLMGIVAILVGMVALLGDWFLRMRFRGNDNDRGSNQVQVIMFVLAFILALLAPIVAKLIQLAISRRREFLADASGVMITKYPDGLIGALKKISADTEPLEAANRATAHLYIVNPLKGKEFVGWFANMFNTHPPMEQRIKELEKMR